MKFPVILSMSIIFMLGDFSPAQADSETFSPLLSAAELKEELEVTSRQILNGLDGCLRSTSGLLFTNTEEKTFLSETVGLEMMLHLVRGDRVSFERQVRLLKAHFIGPLGLLSWQLDETFVPMDSWNASVDDLRVVKALILADRLWGNADYIQTAKSISAAILENNVKDGVLLDGCSWKRAVFMWKYKVDQIYDTSTLTYADITAMRLISEIDSEWVPVLQRMSGVLVEGVTGRDSPWWLFRPDSNSYEETDQDDEIIGKIWSLMYLAEAGFIHSGTLDAVTSASGKLLDNYGNENISVISLAAMFLHQSGRNEEALLTLGRLLDFRNDASNLSGLLGYEDKPRKFSAWAFDNLLALLAMEEILGSGK